MTKTFFKIKNIWVLLILRSDAMNCFCLIPDDLSGVVNRDAHRYFSFSFTGHMSSLSFTTSLKTNVSIWLALANRKFLSRSL